MALVLFAALALGAPRVAAAPSARAGAGPKIPLIAVLVARTFLRAVVDRDLKTAAPLLADKVDFDGQVVTGNKKVKKRLAALFARMKSRRRLRKVAVLPLARAQKLFGPPPSRLKLAGKNLVVAFGRFRRGGLVVFLAPFGERWRVLALTD